MSLLDKLIAAIDLVLGRRRRQYHSVPSLGFTIDASNDGGHWSDKGIISPVNPGA